MSELQQTFSLDLSKRPELPADYKTFRQVAQSLEVKDETSFAIANEMILRQDAWDSRVEKFFEKSAKAAYSLWKSIVGKGTDKEEPGLIVQLKRPMEVRDVLVPRMKSFRKQQDEARRAEELRLQREAELVRHKAEEEARRIQAAADAEAQKLREAGNMRAAKEAQIEAARKALEAVEAAQILQDVGTVLPDVRPNGGPGESRPWIAEVTDIKAMCLAIGQGKIPLEYEIPKRGGGSEKVLLVSPNMAVLNYLAKRLGRADIGVPGANGTRSLQLRFSAKDAPVTTSTASFQSGAMDDKDGWD